MTLNLGRASIPATVATPLCATMQHLDGRASESTHLIIPLVGTLQWTLTYNTNIFTLGAHTHGPIHLPLPPCLFSLLQKPVTREPPCGHVHEPVDRCNSMCWFSSAQCVVRGLGFLSVQLTCAPLALLVSSAVYVGLTVDCWGTCQTV